MLANFDFESLSIDLVYHTVCITKGCESVSSFSSLDVTEVELRIVCLAKACNLSLRKVIFFHNSSTTGTTSETFEAYWFVFLHFVHEFQLKRVQGNLHVSSFAGLLSRPPLFFFINFALVLIVFLLEQSYITSS